VVAPVGTTATIEVALQLVIEVAAVPLNFTVLVPWVVPKFVPVIVTEAPTAPEVGERLVIVGVASTVNVGPVTDTPLTVTTTVPVVAPVGTVTTIEVLAQLVIAAAVPLNFTVPAVVPKFVPVIVTEALNAPEVGERLVIVGVASTVNDTPLLATPPTVSTTLPVVAPVGTTATMEVLLQLVIEVADVPLNFTVLVPCVVPKFVPVIVTEAPTAPEVGERLLIVGVVASTVNVGPVIDTPLTVTTTVPVVAPVGTGTTIEVLAQLVIVAAVPLNFTVPAVVPRFVPVIVTVAPTAPEVGERLVTVGVASTVNEVPLLDTALTVTTTLPVVAPVGTTATMEVLLQLVIEVAAVPLNFTVLVPCVVPKFVPVIVTEVPTAPEVGERLLSVGVASTVNEGPVTDTPLTVTTTVPVVAPVGTFTTIDVLAQLVIVAAVPLNFTVPAVVPRFVPVIVTEAPTAPEVGERLVTVGVASTVNEVPLLDTPLTTTTTLPVVAPVGTFVTIDVLLHVVIVAAVPLNFTVLVPCVVPKFVPVIVTVVVTAPEVGDRLVTVGVAALPTTGAQTIARKTSDRETKEVTLDVRFI
jgi:hypothetical protein